MSIKNGEKRKGQGRWYGWVVLWEERTKPELPGVCCNPFLTWNNEDHPLVVAALSVCLISSRCRCTRRCPHDPFTINIYVAPAGSHNTTPLSYETEPATAFLYSERLRLNTIHRALCFALSPSEAF